MKRRWLWIPAAFVFILACHNGPLPPTREPTASATILTATAESTLAPETTVAQTVEVKVYFTVADSINMDTQAVDRIVPASGNMAVLIRSTLAELLKGPTDAEKAQGLTSWFSPATADCITGAAYDPDGSVWVYFTGLNTIIPNASTSAGSQMLLSELDATVFQFDQIQTVWYLLDDSSASFWEWLQYEDHPVTRADWAGG
jgi:Sporulation and spore germination